MKNKIIHDSELIKLGLEKLNDALTYLDICSSFEGKNLARLIYIAMYYGENIRDEK